MEFKKQCPLCGQGWSKFNGDICPDCVEAKKTIPKGKAKIVSYDAIEPEPEARPERERADLNG